MTPMFGSDFWKILRIIYIIIKALVRANPDDFNGDLDHSDQVKGD